MSSIERKLSVAEAYHEFTLETNKEKSKLFQCGVCFENNTRRYMLCCEGTTKNSSYICSGCWMNWFGDQQKIHCPFPYCREKLLQKSLSDVGRGHRSVDTYECPCCGKLHREETTHHRVNDDNGRPIDISFHGDIPPNFNISEAINKIKTIVTQPSGTLMDGVMRF